MWEQPPLLCRHSFSPGEESGLLRVQEPRRGWGQAGAAPRAKQTQGSGHPESGCSATSLSLGLISQVAG